SVCCESCRSFGLGRQTVAATSGYRITQHVVLHRKPRSHNGVDGRGPRARYGRFVMVSEGPAEVLHDRRDEREALERLLDAVRGGQSRVLVVSGEAGVGKTAPL